MASVDFHHLSTQERLDLIGEIWSTLEPQAVEVTSAQKLEIERRLATLHDDIASGQDAVEVLADLRRRFG